MIKFAVRNRGVVVAAALIVLIYGGISLFRAGLDIFPEFSPKQIIIQTESPGYSADQVETLVTLPIEQALAGLLDLDHIRSESIQGLSVVTAIFKEHTNIFRDRNLVNQRLAGLAASLPAGVAPPTSVPLSSSSATVLTLGVRSDTLDLMQLRSLVDWTIVPRLMAAPGVADINTFGGKIRQLQIQVDPAALVKYDIELKEVSQAAAHFSAAHGGGFFENGNQRFVIRIAGIDSPREIESVVVKQTQNSVIKISDLAKVIIGHSPPIGAASILGHPGIVMMVIGQYGANTLTVSGNVEIAISEIAETLEKQNVDVYPTLFRPADYILRSVRNLTGHLLLGGLFVIAVLYLFLLNLRTALICALAIPLSLLSAILTLLQTGANLNIMILGGLAIALGEVVDDAIIDTENIFRRLRENRRKANPQPALSVVISASLEIRKSVAYASLIVALVFVPLLTLDGIAGRLFSPLAAAYILAILMSLLVALTLTPALCALLLATAPAKVNDPPLISWLTPRYGKLLQKLSSARRTTVLTILGLCLAATASIPFLEGHFLPQLREGHFIVHTASIPGTSLTESLRIGRQLTAQFLQIKGVESVSQWAGRAERGADTFGSHYSEYEIRLARLSGAEQQQILNQLREVLRRFPGILSAANSFLTERVDETISGYSAPLVVNIYGEDLDQLDDIAHQIAHAIRSTPGATDVQVRSPSGTPYLHFRMRPERMAHWGIRPEQIIDVLDSAYGGLEMGTIYSRKRPTQLVITMQPESRGFPTKIGRLPVKAMDGTWITLDRVVEIDQRTGRYNILHRNGQRLQTVTANVSGTELSAFVDQIRQRIFSSIQFATGYYPEITGAAAERAKTRNKLFAHSILVGCGVMLLIYLVLANFRLTLITLVNLPFSMIGGIFTAVISDASFSVGSMVGFVTLFGITVRNSIMLITHYQHLVAHEAKTWSLETVVLGAQQRLPSILMTALVTTLAMLPIAINSDNPGREIMGPMALIVIGGLVSSTILNLLALPTFLLHYARSEDFRDPERHSY